MNQRSRNRFDRYHGLHAVWIAASILALVAGCGGGGSAGDGSETTSPSADQQDGGTNRPDAETSPAPENTPSSSKADSDLVHTDSEGRKWIGEIPYDVWFEDPVAIANDTRPVGGGEASAEETDSSSMPEPAAQPSNNPEPESAPSGDFWAADQWKEIIPAAVLESETKRIGNRLRQFLQTLGKYNGHYQEIEVDGVTLAALGTIAHHHPEPVNWNDRALVVRDLGTAIADASTSLGREAYETAQQPYESLAAILRGSRPSGVSEPDPDAGLLFTVYRTGMMKRMERAFNRLSKNINTESAFRESPETVLHEASLLGALGRLASHQEYPSAEEEEYQEYAAELVQGSLEMKQAVQEESFSKYDTALNRVQKSCAACHSDYRFAGDDFGF